MPLPSPGTVYTAYDGGSDHAFAGRGAPSLGPGPCANAVVKSARTPEGEGEAGVRGPRRVTLVVLSLSLRVQWDPHNLVRHLRRALVAFWSTQFGNLGEF
jgi:hypothetical protein